MVDAPPRPRSSLDLDVDVCVIGGGLAGLTTAREVARRGWSVVLLEAGRWRRALPAAIPVSCCRVSAPTPTSLSPGLVSNAPRICGRWRRPASIMCAPRSVPKDAPGIDPQNGWLYVSKKDNSDEFVSYVGAARRTRLRDRGLADRAVARGAAQRTLLLRHQLPAGDHHPSAQLCARARGRRRTRRRAHFRTYAGFIDRSDRRAQAHRHARRAVARRPRRAVRQCGAWAADAAPRRHAGADDDLCDHHRAARRASCRSRRLSRRRERYRPCRQSLPHRRRRPPDAVGPCDGAGREIRAAMSAR